MSLSTTHQYDPSLYEVKGLVSATHTEALSLFRGAVAELGALFGGKSDLMNKKVNDVMEMLQQKLKLQLQPNQRIIALHFEFTEFGRAEGQNFLSGIATGTLLEAKSKQKGGRTRKLYRK